MDPQLLGVAAAALAAGGVIGFSIGQAYGITKGWHRGYRSAQGFYQRKKVVPWN